MILMVKDFKVNIAGNYIVDIDNFEFQKGYIYSIFGKSGEGKSTFLKALGSLITYEGSIYFNGEIAEKRYPKEELRKKVHYIKQTPEFIPGSVIFNLKYIFSFKVNKGIYFDEDYLFELLERFSLSRELLDKEVKNLSGGEKQRMSIIRSLMIRPEFVLLDEPTSALDIHTEGLLIDFLRSISKDIGVVVVTHSPNMIMESDVRLYFEKGGLSLVENRIDIDAIKSMLGGQIQ